MINYYNSEASNSSHLQPLGHVIAFASDDATQETDELTEQRSIVSEISTENLSLSRKQQQQQDAVDTMKQQKYQQAKGLTRRCIILLVLLLLLLLVVLTTVLVIVVVLRRNKPPSNNPNLEIQGWQQVGSAIQDSVVGLLGVSLALSANGMIVAAGAPHATSELQYAAGQVATMEWDKESQEWYSMMGNHSTTANGNDPDEVAALLAGSSLSDFFGSAVALSASGWTLAAGASRGGDDDEGYVRVFDWNNSTQTWQQVGQNLTGLMAKEGFGESVALSAVGDALAVGATLGGDMRGFVRVFSKNKNGTWETIGQELMGTSAGDEYGKAVALSEDGRRLAVGASQQQTTRMGLAQVFEYDSVGNLWRQRGNTLHGHGKDHWFGEALDLAADGNILAVGQRGGGNGAGQVHVFLWNQTTFIWDPMGQTLQGKNARDNFGSSVALSSDGQTLVVGGDGNDLEGNGAEITKNAGHVRVFAWDRKKLIWQQVGQDISGEASFESLGSTVALSADGTIVAAGGPTKNGFSGNVRVFRAVF